MHALQLNTLGCGDVALPPEAMVESYSNGVVNGSRAIVKCKHGYAFVSQIQSMMLQCDSKLWKNVVEDTKREETLRETWSALCYNVSYFLLYSALFCTLTMTKAYHCTNQLKKKIYIYIYI